MNTKFFENIQFDQQLAQTDTPVVLFSDALKAIREWLSEAYSDGAPSAQLVKNFTRLMDELIVRAWRYHFPQASDNLTIAAVGGYGREELHYGSDIDLLVLFDKKLDEHIREQLEIFVRFLWDIRLEVGHSVRSVKECIKEARKDVSVITNLMEARLLDGSRTLFDDMLDQTGPDKIWPPRKFFDAKLDEQRSRHARFDDTPYKLEPNIKESPGGLRDLHMILWLSQRITGATNLKQLVTQNILRREEYSQLVRSRNFLWKVRNGLHLLVGRSEDRLLFDYQRTLAKQLHYQDRDDRLAVEQFMRRYYRSVRQISLLNEILIQHFQEQFDEVDKQRVVNINAHFQTRGGYLETISPNTFSNNPSALLEIFLILQQHPRIKGIRADTIRELRNNLNLINRSFRHNPDNQHLFLEILRQPAGLTNVYRQMNRYGVLGAFIPAYDRISGQMQHDLFHIYTVDEHTMMVVRNLRRLNLAKYRHEFPLASELMVEVIKPERLYLAALFHDIGKGRGGDHSVLGAEEALHFCQSLNMSEYDSKFTAWLVRHHLLMSTVAQRQDISDPDVVLDFAKTVGDLEHLKQLYLLTVADIRATNTSVWNAWKGKLLAQLYYATHRAIRRGFTTPQNMDDRLNALTADLPAALDKYKMPRDCRDQCRERIWSLVSSDYLMRYDVDDIAWHIYTLSNNPCLNMPLISGRHRTDVEAAEFLAFMPDNPEMLPVLASGFDAAGMNIIDARVNPLRANLLLITFVTIPQNEDEQPPQDQELLKSISSNIQQALINEQIQPVRKSLVSRARRQFAIQTRVDIEDHSEKNVTIIEVFAQDRPGLLHRVFLALTTCKVRLVNAKIGTFGEHVEDVFFVTDRDGMALGDPKQIECLRKEIIQQIDTLLG